MRTTEVLSIRASELAEGPILLVSSAPDRFDGGPDAKREMLLSVPKTNPWPLLRRPVSKGGLTHSDFKLWLRPVARVEGD